MSTVDQAQVTALHRLAMELAHQASAAQDKAEAEALYRRALESERAAADLLQQEHQLEPTRSILYRSAASLALRCRDHQEAERLIGNGLAGNPPEEIAAELRDLLVETLFRGATGQQRKNEDRHRASPALLVDRDMYLIWLNEGAGQQVAQDRVAAACGLWLRQHAHGLQESELRDITWNAMDDTYVETKTKALSVDDSLRFLEHSLNAKRAAEKRRHQRHASLTALAQEPQRMKAPDFEEDLIRRDFWQQTARLLERHMMTAFISLSERDQDIIAVRYGLEEIGDPTRQHIYPEFPSPEAEKKAALRARVRLSKHLEALLTAELDVANKLDRPLYEAALAVVRGGKVSVPAHLTGD